MPNHGTPSEPDSGLTTHRGEDHKSARRRIIDATIALVEERGMTEVSMTAIADRAKLSRQTVYNNFPNVEAAVCAFMIDEIDGMVEQIDSRLAEMGDPATQLREFVRMAMQRFAIHDVAMSLRMAMSPEAEAVIASHLTQAQRVLGRIIDEGVEAGEFRTHMTSEATAETLFHMIGGLAPAVAHGADPELIADRVSTMVLEGLRC
jgi:AcrR family transcriptional regulator